ncbi:hypothetical protein [Mesoplasma photuris]|uniref:hypothetical protein n=1 Tax=Mesoplasma photuris TaxID=217731 RepID=UPI0004E18405|nr:hypothetical protein [Mesoplasma photuris]
MTLNELYKIAKDKYDMMNEVFYTTMDSNLAYTVKSGPMFTYEAIFKIIEDLKSSNFEGDLVKEITSRAKETISIESEKIKKDGAPQRVIEQLWGMRNQGISMFLESLNEKMD